MMKQSDGWRWRTEERAGVTEKAAGGASGGVPGSDGGEGKGRRCTTQIDRGRDIFFHWTNYLWERIRGFSQRHLPPSACQSTAEHILSAKGKENIIHINTAGATWRFNTHLRDVCDSYLFCDHSGFLGFHTLGRSQCGSFAMRGNKSVNPDMAIQIAQRQFYRLQKEK